MNLHDSAKTGPGKCGHVAEVSRRSEQGEFDRHEQIGLTLPAALVIDCDNVIPTRPELPPQ